MALVATHRLAPEARFVLPITIGSTVIFEPGGTGDASLGTQPVSQRGVRSPLPARSHQVRPVKESTEVELIGSDPQPLRCQHQSGSRRCGFDHRHIAFKIHDLEQLRAEASHLRPRVVAKPQAWSIEIAEPGGHGSRSGTTIRKRQPVEFGGQC